MSEEGGNTVDSTMSSSNQPVSVHDRRNDFLAEDASECRSCTFHQRDYSPDGPEKMSDRYDESAITHCDYCVYAFDHGPYGSALFDHEENIFSFNPEDEHFYAHTTDSDAGGKLEQPLSHSINREINRIKFIRYISYLSLILTCGLLFSIFTSVLIFTSGTH